MAAVRLTRAKGARTRLARRFQALADPNRLHLLEVLTGGEHCVCDLQDIVGAGQSLLSFHLKTLKEAGLVTDRRAGRWAYYAIAPAGFDGLLQFMGSLGESTRASPPSTGAPSRGEP